jgi:hypothetical protein
MSDLVPVSQRIMDVIARAASDPAVDVTKMQALLDMQRQLMADQARSEFDAAYRLAAAEMPRITKRGHIEYPASKEGRQRASIPASIPYAKWEDIDAAIKPIEQRHGFNRTFDTEFTSTGFMRVGTLHHRSGHSRSVRTPPLPLDTSGGKNSLQGAGSTATYGNRFVTRDLWNLVFEGEDDDGVKGGAGPLLTEEQYKQLADLVTSMGGGLDRLLEYMGVQALSDIPQSQFHIALNMLNARKRARENKA